MKEAKEGMNKVQEKGEVYKDRKKEKEEKKKEKEEKKRLKKLEKEEKKRKEKEERALRKSSSNLSSRSSTTDLSSEDESSSSKEIRSLKELKAMYEEGQERGKRTVTSYSKKSRSLTQKDHNVLWSIKRDPSDLEEKERKLKEKMEKKERENREKELREQQKEIEKQEKMLQKKERKAASSLERTGGDDNVLWRKKKPIEGELPKPAVDKRGDNSKLLDAARSGNVEKIQKCLEIGADVDCRDVLLGYTPLMITVMKGYSDAARLLIQWKADVNFSNKSDSWTPLHHACLGSSEDIVGMLLDEGANVNAVINEKKSKSKKGQTPLHLACEKANGKIVSLLIEGGANINTADAKNRTPLDALMAHVRTKSEPMEMSEKSRLIKLLVLEGGVSNVKDSPSPAQSSSSPAKRIRSVTSLLSRSIDAHPPRPTSPPQKPRPVSSPFAPVSKPPNVRIQADPKVTLSKSPQLFQLLQNLPSILLCPNKSCPSGSGVKDSKSRSLIFKPVSLPCKPRCI